MKVIFTLQSISEKRFYMLNKTLSTTNYTFKTSAKNNFSHFLANAIIAIFIANS